MWDGGNRTRSVGGLCERAASPAELLSAVQYILPAQELVCTVFHFSRAYLYEIDLPSCKHVAKIVGGGDTVMETERSVIIIVIERGADNHVG
jgi:hypothetical protein